ncbi:MAG: hypothetical protein Q8933_15170 [Bacteroidota bacterium]|nr:hypothetical protein [Bacteroidota bacterium]MDP4194801.1 hypothetical protein [Bacteroidota bacterium]
MLKDSESSFLLSKWYVDLIDPQGNLFIIYIGRLKFGRLNIYYSSLLRKIPHEKSSDIYTLKKYEAPQINEKTFFWKSKDLGVELNFLQAGNSAKKNIIEIPEGFIKWHCIHTKSIGELVVNGKECFKGLGYVERLDMTIKPWKLPFNELRWGRYISDKNSIVWIDIRGEFNYSMLLNDKAECDDPLFYDDRITFANTKNALQFYAPEDIRKGEIISSTFSKIKMINKFIPSGLLKIYEDKSVAKADLLQSNDLIDTGWALYEVVRWL